MMITGLIPIDLENLINDIKKLSKDNFQTYIDNKEYKIILSNVENIDNLEYEIENFIANYVLKKHK